MLKRIADACQDVWFDTAELLQPCTYRHKQLYVFQSGSLPQKLQECDIAAHSLGTRCGKKLPQIIHQPHNAACTATLNHF